MKNLKKIFVAILIASTMMFVVPIINNIPHTSYMVEAATIKISKSKYVMNVGEKYTLKVTGTKKKIKWSSSNTKIAKVNENGKVTAKNKGIVTITAKVGNKKYKCEIKVEKPSINKTSKTIRVKESYKLKITGTSQKIKWSTSDKKIATVNSKGKVVAKKKGIVTITAKVGNTKYTCKIKVAEEPKYSTLMESKTYNSTNWALIKINNKGTKPIKIYSSGASLIDPYYSTYDRNLTLAKVKDNKATPTSSVTIKPGKTVIVYFYTATPTFYDKLTKVKYYFDYDGKSYYAYSSYYSTLYYYK